MDFVGALVLLAFESQVCWGIHQSSHSLTWVLRPDGSCQRLPAWGTSLLACGKDVLVIFPGAEIGKGVAMTFAALYNASEMTSLRDNAPYIVNYVVNTFSNTKEAWISAATIVANPSKTWSDLGKFITKPSAARTTNFKKDDSWSKIELLGKAETMCKALDHTQLFRTLENAPAREHPDTIQAMHLARGANVKIVSWKTYPAGSSVVTAFAQPASAQPASAQPAQPAFAQPSSVPTSSDELARKSPECMEAPTPPADAKKRKNPCGLPSAAGPSAAGPSSCSGLSAAADQAKDAFMSAGFELVKLFETRSGQVAQMQAEMQSMHSSVAFGLLETSHAAMQQELDAVRASFVQEQNTVVVLRAQLATSQSQLAAARSINLPDLSDLDMSFLNSL